jgi:hypothetical protein
MELSFPVTNARFVQRQSVCQSNKTLEAVNIVVCSESHFAIMNQEPSCLITGIPTDDESPCVLIFMGTPAKRKSFANRLYQQCVKRKHFLHFHTPVNDRVAIFGYMVFYS